MYKKLFFILMGVILLSHPSAFAQEVSGYPIGFCNGEKSERSNMKFSGKGAEVSAAIHIPASYAATVAGNHLDIIKVALASKMNLKWLRVWVRTELDGDNLAAAEIQKADLSQGWNCVPLDTPYDIPVEPGDGFYIGYTYQQTNKAGAISTLPEVREGGLWTKCNDEEWTDNSADGTLCIEGLVFGDNLPKQNLSLISVLPDPYFIISEGFINCVAKVRNLATVTATGFDIEATVEGVEQPCSAHIDCNLPIGEIASLKFSISPEILSAIPDTREVSFTVTSVNGEKDEDMGDNTAEASFKVLERAFPRTVLAEEFTTEQCPNCPAVAEYFHELIADPTYSDNLEIVCHHAGYSTDPLTTPFDEIYCWFYNDGGATYAPAVMIDRKTHEDTSTPVFFPSSLEELENSILTQMKIPALVSVVPSCSFDETRGSITVSVTGERVKDDILDGDRITVWLVEDNIETTRQAGTGGTYIHNHVNRAVNATWGVPITWEGDGYSYSCEFSPKDDWNLQNMKAVAFISSYNPENPNECGVANSGSCSINATAIEETINDGQRSVIAIYNAYGVKTERLSTGLNIIVYDNSSTEKVIIRQ